MGEKDLVVVLDFDGTLTLKDIGDEICDRFAPPAWRAIDEEWVSGTLSLPEAQRRMWAMARATRAEAVAHARAIGKERPGLEALLAKVKAKGGRLWLASGGFDFYIEALLGDRKQQFERTYYNATRFSDGRIDVSFPHTALVCPKCAVCKGNVCDLARREAGRGGRVVFIGDGASDRCAIGRADEVAAVRGGLLARALTDLGADHTAFEDFNELDVLFS